MSAGLVFQNLVAGYRKKTVLHGVSFVAPRGQITALLGPNGSGKSTLLKSVLGLLSSTGELCLDGVDVRGSSPLERAQSIAYVPQRTYLTARLSVAEVVEMGRFAHRGPFSLRSQADELAVKSAMKSAGVGALSSRVFTELSGGERQRVLLARALATGAKTLLLDEPTSALDVRQVLTIHRVLRQLAAEGCCIVVVLHGLGEAKINADRAVLLASGRVVHEGPVGDVIQPQAVREVYGVELVPGGALGFSLPKEAL
jgi:iron complex transport system ATP-binding protein